MEEIVMEIAINLQRETMHRSKPIEESKLGFGRYFSNHMFLMNYREEAGWENPRIQPYGKISLEPASAVFHYAQEIFENHKAFRNKREEVVLFRVNDYLDRLSNSADRMCMPNVPRDLHLEGLRQLIRIDKDWVPSHPMTALNIRHAMIAIEPFLGVRPAKEYIFFIITGPVGAYFSEGLSPVKILVEDIFVRAALGGVGNAKTGGNYAASLKAQSKAQSKGYAQVLWLDANQRKFIEEVGAMNIFFKFKDELVTPPLTGTILPGITRDSVIRLVKDMGVVVNERPISIDEVIEKVGSGELREVFGSGTAAIVSPVGVLGYGGKNYSIADGRAGELTQRVLKALTEIQYGFVSDPYGWVDVVA